MMLNEVKTQIFWPTANFENFEILFASLPAVRPGCARCRAPEFHMMKVMAADL